jgi:hypothetical protein
MSTAYADTAPQADGCPGTIPSAGICQLLTGKCRYNILPGEDVGRALRIMLMRR